MFAPVKGMTVTACKWPIFMGKFGLRTVIGTIEVGRILWVSITGQDVALLAITDRVHVKQ